jgi:hypothetical protein
LVTAAWQCLVRHCMEFQGTQHGCTTGLLGLIGSMEIKCLFPEWDKGSQRGVVCPRTQGGEPVLAIRSSKKTDTPHPPTHTWSHPPFTSTYPGTMFLGELVLELKRWVQNFGISLATFAIWFLKKSACLYMYWAQVLMFFTLFLALSCRIPTSGLLPSLALPGSFTWVGTTLLHNRLSLSHWTPMFSLLCYLSWKIELRVKQSLLCLHSNGHRVSN